jgi:dTDP-4-amino-4,6-dideoxygalactose transaminase
VSTLTFAATANAVVYAGAVPVFVDCVAETGNIDVSLVAELLARMDRHGQAVSAVLPVDLFGVCADYTALLPLCAAFDAAVVEDAAEALGATHAGRGAGSFGRAAALSFNGNKIITTSGGGMLLSDDGDLVARSRYLSTQARAPVPHYEHHDIGYNYRLSNLLAALGRAQLQRLDEMMARRRALRERYAKLFAAAPGVSLLGNDDAASNCWLTTIIVDESVAGWSAAALAQHLHTADVETRPMWKPMHLQPVFAGYPRLVNGTADRLFRDGLTLPSGSSLDESGVDRVLATIDAFVGQRR